MKIQGVFHAQVLLCLLFLLCTNFAGSKGGITNHRKVKPNKNSGYNLGEPLSYHPVVSLLQCEDLCLRRQPQCLGYNYHFCEEEKQCELLQSIGRTEETDCVTYAKFYHGDVQKRLLEGCSCSGPRPIKNRH